MGQPGGKETFYIYLFICLIFIINFFFLGGGLSLGLRLKLEPDHINNAQNIPLIVVHGVLAGNQFLLSTDRLALLSKLLCF